ncbi:hypothetical protein ACVWXU_004131 [Streptomyces sp. TE33382]
MTAKRIRVKFPVPERLRRTPAVPGEKTIAKLVHTPAEEVMDLNEQIAEMDKLIEGRFREHELADRHCREPHRSLGERATAILLPRVVRPVCGDAETCCEAGVGVTAAQVGQDEHCLSAPGQATPPGADPTAVTCEETGEVLQGAAGQIDTGRVNKHAKAPGGLVILVVNPSTRSFLHARTPGSPLQPPVRSETAQ